MRKTDPQSFIDAAISAAVDNAFERIGYTSRVTRTAHDDGRVIWVMGDLVLVRLIDGTVSVNDGSWRVIVTTYELDLWLDSVARIDAAETAQRLAAEKLAVMTDRIEVLETELVLARKQLQERVSGSVDSGDEDEGPDETEVTSCSSCPMVYGPDPDGGFYCNAPGGPSGRAWNSEVVRSGCPLRSLPILIKLAPGVR